ncbi:MAG: NADH-quinone oxidoreductase subunit NuoH [Actinomycetota bacterium]|jgi:NADH-quinone oxidoreductase subunit H|nr:NADH-quinone oxidoreductase subunit NuoH [Actinomycetota bacterium]
MTGFVGGAVYGLAGGLVIAVAALFGVWWERKVSARIQMRLGPTEIGPAGLFQTLADTIKLVLKEDITPRQVDRPLFRMAPLLVFTPIAMSLVVIPFAGGWVPLNTSVGMLFFVAVPSVSVIGVLLAGFSSGNTYATLGGLRGAAQMISYELPRTLSVLAMALLAGSLAPLEVMNRYEWWWTPATFIALIVYFISSIAELNRGPFDIPEAESELVAGYFADYSGIRWAIFMMSEYGGLVAASFFGAAIFMGGAQGLPGVFGVLLIFAKALVLITLMMLVKWTFPRFRSDQLLTLAWKVLTPMALVQLVIVGVILPWL